MADTVAAVVDLATMTVVNRIVVDITRDQPPSGCLLIDVADVVCHIGDVYDPNSATFIHTPPVESEDQPEET